MFDQLLEFSGKHPLLVMGVVGTWLAVMIYEIRLKSQGFTHVSSADAVRLINKGAVVVDVRKADEFRAGHIVNAKNIELGDLNQDQGLISKYKNKVVVTVCNNGLASNKAANLLRKAGVAQAFSLRGGLAGWRNEKLPVAK
jgi:rhodanese-related sulfurtransferase